MIHSRRLAHRRSALALAGALPLVLAAGLALRPELPSQSPAPARLLAEAGFATPAVGTSIPLETDVARYEIEILGAPEGALELALRPVEVILAPDLLVYWIANAEADALPGSGAVLLGSLSGTSRRRLALPAAARGAEGQIAVYSLSHGALVDRFALTDAIGGAIGERAP